MAIFRKVFCPVCWRTMGNKSETVPDHPHAVLGQVNQWAQPDQYAGQHKPFGVIQSSTGRGTIQTEGYFDPEDDTDGFFPLVKGRLLAAVQDYIRQGWVKTEEIQAAIGGIDVEHSAPAKKKRQAKAKG